MQCPYLQEARVGQCSCSAFRKMVLRRSRLEDEKCSSPDYVRCTVYEEHAASEPPAGRCPYLDELPMHYCSGAPVSQFIRCSDSPESRCGSERHRYCDLYLALAAGPLPRPPAIPEHLGFAPNHMWLDRGPGDVWHIGVDAFFTTLFPEIERVSFPAVMGARRPVAALTVHGVVLQMEFPAEFPKPAPHRYLRAKPAAIASDPYGQGWLFEGLGNLAGDLLQGVEAQTWMRAEVERLNRVLKDLGRDLSQADVLALYDEFFSPCLTWETQA